MKLQNDFGRIVVIVPSFIPILGFLYFMLMAFTMAPVLCDLIEDKETVCAIGITCSIFTGIICIFVFLATL